jgi:phage tail sheath gpL-like
VRDTHVAGEPGDIITTDDVVNNNIAVCKQIEREGGLNSVDSFVGDFTAERHSSVPGRIDSQIPIDIVDAAHIFANTIKVVSSV